MSPALHSLAATELHCCSSFCLSQGAQDRPDSGAHRERSAMRTSGRTSTSLARLRTAW